MTDISCISFESIVRSLCSPWPIESVVARTSEAVGTGRVWNVRPGADSQDDFYGALDQMDGNGGHVINFLAGTHSGEYRVRGGNAPGTQEAPDGQPMRHNRLAGQAGHFIEHARTYDPAQDHPIIDVAGANHWDTVGLNLGQSPLHAIRYMAANGTPASPVVIHGNNIGASGHAAVSIRGWFDPAETLNFPSSYVLMDGNFIDGLGSTISRPNGGANNQGFHIGSGSTWTDITHHVWATRNEVTRVQAESFRVAAGANNIWLLHNMIHDSQMVAGSAATNIPYAHVSLQYALAAAAAGQGGSVETFVEGNRLWNLTQDSGTVRPPITVGRNGTDVLSNLLWNNQAASGVVMATGAAAGWGNTSPIRILQNSSDKTVATVEGNAAALNGVLQEGANVPDQEPNASFVGPLVGSADNGSGPGSGLILQDRLTTGLGLVDANGCLDNEQPGALSLSGTRVREIDFSGGAADLAGWAVYDGPGHANNGIRDPDKVQIVASSEAERGGHVMRITASQDPNDGLLHSGGAKLLGHQQRCGRYRFRVRVTPDPDQVTSGVILLWPWLNDHPEGGEVDWWETGTEADRVPTKSFLHFPIFGIDNQTEITHLNNNDGSDWHIYEGIWTAERMTFSIDGGPAQTISTDRSEIPNGFMDMTVQLDAFPGPGQVQGVDQPVLSPGAEIVMECDWIEIEDLYC